MKKIFHLCAFLFVLCAFGISEAYTSADVDTANALAKNNLIVDQSADPSKYRLDTPISRQEVIGITLKLLGVPSPNNYTCKGYFGDAIFGMGDPDSWVCRAVELAADRMIVTRENPKVRPKDNISRVEALAIAWKGSGQANNELLGKDGIFYDTKNKPAELWQGRILQNATDAGVITPIRDTTTSELKLLWRHTDTATRAEVFRIVNTLWQMKKSRDQTMYMNFSGEAVYKPNRTRIVSSDEKIARDMTTKKFESALAVLSPKAAQYRTEGTTIFVMQYTPGVWGQVTYSSISSMFGKVYQHVSAYNPYEDAIKAMLKEFKIASEKEFYALPYGDLYEKTRDFVENYYIDQFASAPIVMPTN